MHDTHKRYIGLVNRKIKQSLNRIFNSGIFILLLFSFIFSTNKQLQFPPEKKQLTIFDSTRPAAGRHSVSIAPPQSGVTKQSIVQHRLHYSIVVLNLFCVELSVTKV